jgi:hypothetical protein
MVRAYAKKYSKFSLPELESMLDEWVPGSEERAGILTAISEKKKEQKESKWTLSNRLALWGIIITVLLGLFSIPFLSEWLKP